MAARVVVAMSGGVDSSVAAYLLKREGYDVIGLFMRTGAHGADDSAPSRKRGCCSALDAGDARRVADQLDIPFYALDFESDFNRIIDYFADEYLVGRTPNPCVVCNNWLKFGKLWEYGEQLRADFVATGHYARLIHSEGRTELHRALDPAKDQSYVLFGLQPHILPRILFPLGGLLKEQVRDTARAAGLAVAEKPDSVEICFVPDGDHGSLIRERRPGRAAAGPIVDTSGRVLAEHHGIENFTVGQRKKLGFAAGQRRYVLRLVPSENTVVVGDREELLAQGLIASRVNWLLDDPPDGSLACAAKIRYRHQPAFGHAIPLPDDGVRMEFDEPQSAVTPGQAVVLYAGSRVLGGGWIDRQFPVTPNPTIAAATTR
jgi:tRNA-specific 2-thiouridylase